VAVRPPGALDRRVVVKAHVVRMTPYGAKAAALHLRYIEREGVEKDGSEGRLYAADGTVLAEVFERARPGEKHQFRLIVSPEDAGELDLTAYVRRLMARVEKDLGRRLEWAAVNHFDTEHPHAHVVVRGVDRDGHEVRLDRGYISNGLRWRAQELATEELGPRRELDVQLAQEREVTQDRFTSLDRAIERQTQDHRLELRSGSLPGRFSASNLLARLEHLEDLGLARRGPRSSWTLTDGWQEQLRELGARRDILKQIHKALSGDRTRYRIVRAGEALDPDAPSGSKVLFGRVAAKGLSDELKGAYYAVLETPSGGAYHVPLSARAADQFRVGDVVSFGTRPEPTVRPIDRHIAETARQAGGVYVHDGGSSDLDRAGVGRRLRELEREGLATRQGSDRWAVPADLIAKLESRPRAEPPRQQLWVKKLPVSLEAAPHHRGPVWLDRVDEASLAPWGFGAEVRRAVEGRRETLRALGIAADDAHRDRRLREIERLAVGEAMAARTGQEFLTKTPDGFRGRLQLGPEGAPYAVVSDGARFVLVPASRELHPVAGSTVIVGGDARGRKHVSIDASDRDRGR
jgi:type IV secretory pathway VirD2 relaxase